MFKSILFTLLFLLSSLNSSAAFIYADDFAVGENVTHLTSNATLHWLEGTGISTESTIIDAPTYAPFRHQYFGGLTEAGTCCTSPGLHNETHGSPNPQKYKALEISFSSGVRSFGFQAENISGDNVGAYFYDTAGIFLQSTIAFLNQGGPRPYVGNFHYNFDVDIGKIRLGGEDSFTYIYALDVEVPEPSPVLLLVVGLLSVIAVRRYKAF